MRTFKKKDFKKMVIESNTIDELVKDDGSFIGGDEKYNMGVDVKTGPINMTGDIKGISIDTDKFASQAIQPRNWWWSLSYGTGQGRGKSPIGSNIGLPNDSDNLDESELTSEQKMRKMVEDILSKQSKNKDIVKRTNSSDVNRGGIPDIEELSNTKLIVVGKLADLIDTINAMKLSGEELGIVLYEFFKKIDTSDLSSEYKNIIRKQI